MIATATACLLAGAAAGWAHRLPEVMAIPNNPSSAMPVLWIEPQWASVPKQASPEKQMRYAQFQAPPEEWVAAWLAVPGYFHASPEAISRAYIQVARLWYRRFDIDALTALKKELAEWKNAQGSDKELVNVIQIAIDSRKRDLTAVIEGLKTLSREEVKQMYDPALVEICLEITSDAVASAAAGNQVIARDELLRFQKELIYQLYRIEVRSPGPAQKRAIAKRSEPA